MSRPLTIFKVEPINAPPASSVGKSLRVVLEQTFSGPVAAMSSVHVCGRAEVLPDGKLRLEIVDTVAGRHAIAMVADDLVEAVLWQGSVRLRVPGEAKDAAAAWKAGE